MVQSLVQHLSPSQVHSLLNNLNVKIVDVRPLPAYNGWRFGTTRGGHIPKAVSFPYTWFNQVDNTEINRLVQEKDLLPNKEVVIYGSGHPEETEPLLTHLLNLGYSKLRVLEGGWQAWADHETLSVEKLPLYEKLVHTQWLDDLLNGRHPEAEPPGRYRLFHVNFGVPEEYREGHIPTSVYLDTNRLESSHDWNRREPKELDEALKELGRH